jgi:tetratricopeptide (TPR) repeat protein
MSRFLPAAAALAAFLLVSCDQGVESLADYEKRRAAAADERAQVRSLPLPAAGANSEANLRRSLDALPSEEARDRFESAYRLVFTTRKERRDPKRALEELQAVVEEAPRFAPAFRVAGYAYFSGGDYPSSRTAYEAAVKLDPSYGDAHYALALVLAMEPPIGDALAAREHLNRALALGVKDDFGLKGILDRQAAAPAAGASGLPAGHPPMQPPDAASGPPAATDGEALPLKLSGIGSIQELERAYARLHDPALRKSLENGFRYTFTEKTQFRDKAAAKVEFDRVIAADPGCAAAYRGLAYVVYNPSAPDESISLYKKALDLDADYGEAHYALSFILAVVPERRAEGLEHFRRAMSLGVPDERKLGERFYTEAR